MTAVFMASPSPGFLLANWVLFALLLTGGLIYAVCTLSLRTLRKVAVAVVLAVVLAVALSATLHADVYWAPYCEGIFYYVNWLMCSDYINWGG